MTVTKKIFAVPSNEETAFQLSDHMPTGKAWEAKVILDSNLFSLMLGLSKPFNINQTEINKLCNELDVNTTFDLISDHEKSVGLPDDCTDTASTIEQRRANVIERLSKKPIVTIEEMQEYVDNIFPDAGITLYPGADLFNFEYDFEMFFWGDINEKFIIVATVPAIGEQFEYDFEFELTGGVNLDTLRCVLEKVIPANVYLLIIEV